MADEKKYALIVATDFYVIQNEGETAEELENVVKQAMADGYYLHEIEDGTKRYISMARVRFFDILTKEKLRENMEAAQKQREAEMAAAQQQQQQGGPGGQILQLPGRGQ